MAEAAKTLNAVVVGSGFIGPVHVEALRRAGVRVRGSLGMTPEMSKDACLEHGIEPVYLTLEDALGSPDVDVLHFATPNRLHYEHCKAALAAGKHVLCEKPLAMNTEQSRDLVRLAEESGLVAGVSYNIRFYPLCHEVAARLRRPDAGDVIHVTGSYVQDWLLKSTDFNWRVLSEEGGALRAVSDIGTHWLDLLQFVTGQRVVAVCADLRTVHPVRQAPVGGRTTFVGDQGPAAETQPVDIDTEDCGAVMLKFEGGANGVLWVSQTTAGKKNELRFEVSTTNECFSWDSTSPNRIWIGHRDRSNESFERDPSCSIRARPAGPTSPGATTKVSPTPSSSSSRPSTGTSPRETTRPRSPSPLSPTGIIASCSARRSCRAIKSGVG